VREAEESPLLESFARERLLKTQQQARKFLAGFVVNSKMWRSATAL
jgi:hypothetical protein